MEKSRTHLRTRLTALLLALVCVLGLFPTTAFAAADTIKLKDFGMSDVAYQSKALGKCTLHQMYYENGSATTVGFCGTKGGGMGNSLKGQTWGNKSEISDSTVKIMMAYFYAHSTGVFTDEAKAMGVDDVWGPEYTWYMNAWVQACIWRYQQGSISNPVTACAEELVAVYNTLEGTHYTSIDDQLDGRSFRDRTQFILDGGIMYPIVWTVDRKKDTLLGWYKKPCFVDRQGGKIKKEPPFYGQVHLERAFKQLE